MDVLSTNFETLHRYGVWYENDEKYWIMKIAYRILVIGLVYYMTLVELIELLSPGNVDDLTQSLFLTLTYVSLCIKWLNFIFRRDAMKTLMARFTADVCRPRNAEEEKILKRYSDDANKLHLFILNLVFLLAITLTLQPLARFNSKNIHLPIKTYHPYDTSKPFYFWFTYVIQGLAELYAAVINGSFDTLAYGFIILVTGQFQLSIHRLHLITADGKNKFSTKDWIDHHAFIMRTVQDIESFFIGVIAPFFLCCMPSFCASIFRLYQTNVFSMEFLALAFYLGGILFEAFLYCWNGNELRLKCQEVVAAAYNCDWTNLEPGERRAIIFIMQISQKARTISCRGQWILSLDTYVMIVKSSYAAFNLLQGVSGHE